MTGTWCVYLLRLRGGALYCGCTNDLDRRLAAHAGGRGSRIVRARLPFALAFVEAVEPSDRSTAQKREAQIKALTKASKEDLCATWALSSPEKLSADEKKPQHFC